MSWQENTKSGCGRWGASDSCGGSVGGKGTEIAKGAAGEEEKAQGKPEPTDRWAQEAGLPEERKLQVSQKEARKSRMWAAGESWVTS